VESAAVVLGPVLVHRILRALAERRLAGQLADIPGGEAARELALEAGLDVRVAEGGPWDMYVASRREVCLSARVWESREAWALAVAAHEVGHAAEHARGGWPFFLLAAGEMGAVVLLTALASLAAVSRVPAAAAGAVLVLAAGAGIPLSLVELWSEWRASRWALGVLRARVPSAGLRLWYVGALVSHGMLLALWLPAVWRALDVLDFGGGSKVTELMLPSGIVGACAATAVWAGVLLHYRRLVGRLGEDLLTGCLVRRAAERELARLGRRRAGIVVVDVDGLKAVNDRLGHAAGDDLLARAGAALRSCVRRGDIVARWGGDEFLLVLPGVREEDLARVVERVRQALAAADVAASVGWALAGSGDELRECVARADREMYLEKRRKRELALGV